MKIIFKLLLTIIVLSFTSNIIQAPQNLIQINTNKIIIDYSFFDIDIDPHSAYQIISKKIGFQTNKNTIISIEPYEIKINEDTKIEMKDIVIFDNFEILFDKGQLFNSKNNFDLKDSNRYKNINTALDQIDKHYKIQSSNCRYLFSNYNDNSIVNFEMQYLLSSNMNSFLHLYMHMFCFNSSNDIQKFIKNLREIYNLFLSSPKEEQNLVYFNKEKTNKLNVIFKSSKIHNNFEPDAENSNYAYITFSARGLVLSDEIEDRLNTVYDTFNYNTVINCDARLTDAKDVFNGKIPIDSRRCCVNIKIDEKEMFPSSVDICSFKKDETQCNIEARFIRDGIKGRCIDKLNNLLQNVYENGNNIRIALSMFGGFEKQFIFDSIKKFINRKIASENKRNSNGVNKTVEEKLLKMIQDLGADFKLFLEEKRVNGNIGVVKEVYQPLTEFNREIAEKNHMNIPNKPLPPIQSQNTSTSRTLDNIFSICEGHPDMKKCLCVAFPFSLVCNKDYCPLHPNYYQCNPSYCLTVQAENINENEKCLCKFKPFDLKCKCMLNPLNKSCYCLKYPNSVYCFDEYCNNVNNQNELYCLCKTNPMNTECRPNYCYENRNDSRCECLIEPMNQRCRCMSDITLCKSNLK